MSLLGLPLQVFVDGVALAQQESDRPAERGDAGGEERQWNQGVDVVQQAEEIAQESNRDLRPVKSQSYCILRGLRPGRHVFLTLSTS